MTDSRYVTLDELAAAGLTVDDVLQRCPHAIEYRALDGSPCWRRADLAPLLADTEGDPNDCAD
jgi:hypothetical protein